MDASTADAGAWYRYWWRASGDMTPVAGRAERGPGAKTLCSGGGSTVRGALVAAACAEEDEAADRVNEVLRAMLGNDASVMVWLRLGWAGRTATATALMLLLLRRRERSAALEPADDDVGSAADAETEWKCAVAGDGMGRGRGSGPLTVPARPCLLLAVSGRWGEVLARVFWRCGRALRPREGRRRRCWAGSISVSASPSSGSSGAATRGISRSFTPLGPRDLDRVRSLAFSLLADVTTAADDGEALLPPNKDEKKSRPREVEKDPVRLVVLLLLLLLGGTAGLLLLGGIECTWVLVM